MKYIHKEKARITRAFFDAIEGVERGIFPLKTSR